MNEELQNALVQVISDFTSTTSAAKDFMVAELPDVVTQLLWWKGIESFISFLFCIGILLGLQWSGKAIRNSLDPDDYEYTFNKGLALVLQIIATLGMTSIALGQTAWLQIMVAPKLYLIEYTAKLVQ